MNPEFPISLSSVFDQVFDAIVFGGGLVGVAAARRLAGEGRSVLLVESSGVLLWELTEALDNRALGEGEVPGWQDWLAELGPGVRGGDGRYLQPALMEIALARLLVSAEAPFRVLFYAAPCKVMSRAGRMESVVVATKQGRRVLRARQWLDATEEGRVCALAGMAGRRRPLALQRGVGVAVAGLRTVGRRAGRSEELFHFLGQFRRGCEIRHAQS